MNLRPVAAFVAVVLLTGCASTKALRVAQVTYTTAQVLDVASTHAAISAGAVEANPFLVTDWRGQTVIKAAETGAALWLSERLSHEHPRLAAIVLSALTVSYGLIAHHNYRLAGGAR